MSSRSWLGHVRVIGMVLAMGTGLAAPLMAQAPAKALAKAPAKPPAQGASASDPIACWWKTDTNAVQIGQHFTLTLTCSVLETGSLAAAPDVKPLEPTTLQLAPFEVLGGVHHEDLDAPPRRYFQYEYTLRLLGENFFGQDVDIPSINVSYNTPSAAAGGTPGRDQVYALPALPMRILSLVPGKASDIRDAPRDTFGDIEARKFRATEELLAAGVCFVFAVVVVGFGLVRVAGGSRSHGTAVARPLSPRALLSGCLGGIKRLKAEVALHGWTPELAGRALTVFRVAGAVALDRPVAQPLVATDVAGREGQLVLPQGILRRKRALVSAPTTEEAIASHLGNGNLLDARAQSILQEIRESLQVFGAARYGRDAQLSATALDRTLDKGAGAIRRLHTSKLWPLRMGARFGGIAWSRSENS